MFIDPLATPNSKFGETTPTLSNSEPRTVVTRSRYEKPNSTIKLLIDNKSSPSDERTEAS